MAIWEPCNYVSNLAYDRLVVEICNQEDWTLGEMDVIRIAEAFAIGIIRISYIFSFCVLKHIYCFSVRMNYKCCYSGRGETQALSRKFLRNEILQVLRHRESAVRSETTPKSRDPVFLDP